MPIKNLRDQLSSLSDQEVMIGFDAFIDEASRIVGERATPSEYDAISKISAFGDWVHGSAGRSGLREVVCEERLAGGCSVNMGDSLIALGLKLEAHIGLGSHPDPIFDHFQSGCHRIFNTEVEPGQSTVYEFDDGKLMMCSTNSLAKWNEQSARDYLQKSTFLESLKTTRGIALTTWSVFPYMNEVWKTLLELWPKDRTDRPHVFFDLADPASRSEKELLLALDLLSQFETVGRVTVSFNGNEANQVAKVLGIAPSGSTREEQLDLAKKIRDRLSLSECVIHVIRGACAATKDATCGLDGPYFEKPVRSVGAGDRFNAGYFAGQLIDLPLQDRLKLACSNSGIFVRTGMSASADQLSDFHEEWSSNTQIS